MTDHVKSKMNVDSDVAKEKSKKASENTKPNAGKATDATHARGDAKKKTDKASQKESGK